MAVYSFSQIQTYLQCPLKYKFNYVDKIKPEFEENLHLILGTEVHSALEYLYKQLNIFKTPSYDEIEEFFVTSFNEKAKLLDNDDIEKEEFLTRGKYYLKNYYQKNIPFDPNRKIIGTELKLYIDLQDNIKFYGIIDRVDKIGDTFIITDYKTNKNLPPDDKNLYEEQITLYALGIKQKYGKYAKKIYGNLEYLHFDMQDYWEITDEKIKEIEQKYKKITLEIETKKAEYALGDKTAFLEKENPNCRFCDYKELCPIFAHLYGKVDDIELSETTIKTMIDEYVELSKKKSEIEKILSGNKAILSAYAQRNNLKKIYGEKHSISISRLKNVKILDKEKLKKYLQQKDLLQEVLDIDRFKFQKLLKEKKLIIERGIIEENETFVLRGK